MQGVIARGAAWMLLFRVAEKSLGLISTVVLARLLLPEDFGIVAMAMSIIALVEVASAFGFEVALIQRAHPTRASYDTAWTLNVCVGALCASVMIALAWPAAVFYAEPRLGIIVAIAAAGWLLQSFENIGIVDFRRQMDFRREFLFLGVKRLAGFAATMVLAFTLRNYWALVIGALAGRLAGVALSYAMHPFRPRFSLVERRELFRFSSWLLVANAVSFAELRFAHFFVGRVGGSSSLGFFTLASDLAAFATTEVSAPINRAAHAGYARLAERRDELVVQAMHVIGTIALVTIPAAVGVALVATPLVHVVLGERWAQVVPLLQILVAGSCARAIMSNYHSIFLALGQVRLTPILEGGRVVLLIPFTFFLGATHGLEGVAYAQALSIALGFFVSSTVLVRRLGAAPRLFIAQLVRPIVAASVMAVVVHAVLRALASEAAGSFGLQLACGVAAGVIAYPVALGLVWMLAGRPAGPEQNILAFLLRARARHRPVASP